MNKLKSYIILSVYQILLNIDQNTLLCSNTFISLKFINQFLGNYFFFLLISLDIVPRIYFVIKIFLLEAIYPFNNCFFYIY